MSSRSTQKESDYEESSSLRRLLPSVTHDASTTKEKESSSSQSPEKEAEKSIHKSESLSEKPQLLQTISPASTSSHKTEKTQWVSNKSKIFQKSQSTTSATIQKTTSLSRLAEIRHATAPKSKTVVPEQKTRKSVSLTEKTQSESEEPAPHPLSAASEKEEEKKPSEKPPTPQPSSLSGKVTPKRTKAQELREKRQREKDMTRVQKIKRWIYDKETKKVLGKTCTSWGSLLLFYLLYYIVLMGIFMGLLFLTKEITGKSAPKYGYKDGTIGYPELTVRPFGDKGVIEILLSTDPKKTTHFTDLKEYFEEVKDRLKRPSNFTKKHPDICNEAMSYGYDSNPCVMFRVSTRYGWHPGDKDCSKYLNITCKHMNPDSKSQGANVTYYSSNEDESAHGGRISYCHFPYLSQEKYERPLVMAQFNISITEKPLEFHCWISDDKGENVTRPDTASPVRTVKILKSGGGRINGTFLFALFVYTFYLSLQ